jgi:ATP-dependent RNA helicase DDX35
VLHVHPNSTLFTRKPSSGWVIFHDIEETKKIQWVFSGFWVGVTSSITLIIRMSIITEVEPEW